MCLRSLTRWSLYDIETYGTGNKRAAVSRSFGSLKTFRPVARRFLRRLTGRRAGRRQCSGQCTLAAIPAGSSCCRSCNGWHRMPANVEAGTEGCYAVGSLVESSECHSTTSRRGTRGGLCLSRPRLLGIGHGRLCVFWLFAVRLELRLYYFWHLVPFISQLNDGGDELVSFRR